MELKSTARLEKSTADVPSRSLRSLAAVGRYADDPKDSPRTLFPEIEELLYRVVEH